MNVKPILFGVLAALAGACVSGPGLMAGTPGWNLTLNDTTDNTGNPHHYAFEDEVSVDELDYSDNTTDAVNAGSGSFTRTWFGIPADAYLVSKVGSGDVFNVTNVQPRGAQGYDGVTTFVQGFNVELVHLELYGENGLFVKVKTEVASTSGSVLSN